MSTVDRYEDHWRRVLWSATLDQTKVDIIMELARLNGLFDPAKLLAMTADDSAKEIQWLRGTVNAITGQKARPHKEPG